MNLYDLYTDTFEKVAQSYALKDLDQDVRSEIAAGSAQNNAEYMLGEVGHGHRAVKALTKEMNRSGRKQDKPGILSSIRRGGRERAKAYHRSNHTAASALHKKHSNELAQAYKQSKEHLTHAATMINSKRRGDHEQYHKAANDYIKKHMKGFLATQVGQGVRVYDPRLHS